MSQTSLTGNLKANASYVYTYMILPFDPTLNDSTNAAKGSMRYIITEVGER